MARLPESFLLELKNRCDIETVVSSYVVVKKHGRNLTGLCPFHNEKTPSFTVFPATQSFHCFGCGEGGDAISFVKKIENLEYIEALKLLSERYGLKLPELTGGDDRTAARKKRILEAGRDAARFFYDCLMSDEGKKARDYLKFRRISEKTAKKYGLGYAPDSFSKLTEHLKGLKYTEFEMVDASLAAKGQKSGVYDRFRDRLMFPIIDLRGNIIGFGGRQLSDSGPKYLNSSDTLCFKKSNNLYNLNFAKNSKPDSIILCEGNIDVISMTQAGFSNTVATLGTALTESQARLLSQYTDKIVICYDSDEAGRKATDRAADIIKSAGLKCSVLRLEGAKDPDEYIKKFGALSLKNRLEKTLGVYEYRLNALKSVHDLNTNEGKLSYLKEAVKLLSGAEDIEIEIYARTVAEQCDISAKVAIDTIKTEARRQRKQRQKKQFDESKRNFLKNEQNRYDPDRMKNLRKKTISEELLAALCKHHNLYEQFENGLEPDDIALESDQPLFKKVFDAIKNGDSTDILNLSTELTDDETNRFAEISAKYSESEYDAQTVESLIKAAKNEKNEKIDAAGLNDEDFENYITNLAKNKQ